ncbi:MAG TPA: M50 family metallopeptidase [Pyrinomonadaceae bacterium]|jgi:Peptidase M50B-like|nr:M50 family metallopeptidase [Pyrinomonadaceae bacterium]
MRYRLSHDARPQAMTLLFAATISIVLWFIPFAEFVTYPFRIFVTFIHEGGHALAALLTGNSVSSLSVAMNASGETYTTQGGLISQIFISSAGYVGAMAFGALLLALIRKAVAARLVLLGCGIFVFSLTMIYGLFKPIFSMNAWAGIPFTLLAGTILSVGLVLIARFASARVATFLTSFLAVQCVLNALYDLKTVFFLSSPFETRLAATDAMNMAQATGIPAIFWSVIWIALALGILWFAMRLYVAGRDKSYQPDLPFEETPPI